MRDLRSVIQYECITSFKYIWIFYTIQYAVVIFIMAVLGIVLGGFEEVTVNALEFNTLVYISIVGVLGYAEDFKMLIQNGFTRTYIFIATMSMFCFISGSMALVDTAVGNVLHALNHDYTSVYGGIYGYGNLFLNWLWLFLLYVTFCCLAYLIILVIKKTGKIVSICLGICLGGVVILVAALFKYVLSAETVADIAEFCRKAMGFLSDGRINHLLPAATLLVIAGVLGTGAYAVIRRTEVK